MSADGLCFLFKIGQTRYGMPCITCSRRRAVPSHLFHKRSFIDCSPTAACFATLTTIGEKCHPGVNSCTHAASRLPCAPLQCCERLMAKLYMCPCELPRSGESAAGASCQVEIYDIFKAADANLDARRWCFAVETIYWSIYLHNRGPSVDGQLPACVI